MVTRICFGSVCVCVCGVCACVNTYGSIMKVSDLSVMHVTSCDDPLQYGEVFYLFV